MIYTKDRVLIVKGMDVFYFDPYHDWALRKAKVVNVYKYGPEISTPRGTLLYHRDSIWADESKARSDGPPTHIYRSQIQEVK